jgi:xanthine dehydrogenase accessory factor
MDALLIKKLSKYIDEQREVALVTVTNKAGSGPRDRGSMMIVDDEGTLLYGTIGGGGIEEKAKADAVVCIKNNESKSCHYELTLHDTEDSLHMACGGVVDIFIKVFKSQDHLIIFGAGHIGLVLSQFAKTLGYRVTVIDKRQDFANDERFPHVDQVYAGEFDTVFKNLTIEMNTSIVIVTHGHVHDIDALRLVVNSNARYIGAIGSKTKIRHCFKELMDEGFEKDRLDRVYAPIGLKIGGATPAEIALSIMSEVQAVKFDKNLPFMKNTLEG